jgi:hypothetical protein
MLKRVQVVGQGDPIPPSNYVQFGGVTITNSYSVLKAGFTGSAGLNNLNNWEANNGVHTGSATVFVATHDSERGDVGGSLTPSQTPAYSMANVFMLAYPYGTPTILSSYQFNSHDDGAPNNGQAACSSSATGGQGGFWCQHRWTAISNMVQFRTAVGGTSVDNWTNGNKNQIAFGRQKKGFVVINNDGNAWSTSVRLKFRSHEQFADDDAVAHEPPSWYLLRCRRGNQVWKWMLGCEGHCCWWQDHRQGSGTHRDGVLHRHEALRIRLSFASSLVLLWNVACILSAL